MHPSDAKPAWEQRGLARKATVLSFPLQELVFIVFPLSSPRLWLINHLIL